MTFMSGGGLEYPWSLWPLVLVVGAILGAVSTFLRQWFVQQTARNWPRANATVETYYALSTGSGGDNAFAPVLGYYYEVKGEAYSCSVCLMSYGGPSAADAEESGKSWVGAKIVIRYNPEKPEESAYIEADGAPPGAHNYADQPPA
jgi:hypothetical protein